MSLGEMTTAGPDLAHNLITGSPGTGQALDGIDE